MSVIGQGLIQVLTPLLQVLNQIISALTAVVKSLFPSMSESSGAHSERGKRGGCHCKRDGIGDRSRKGI